MTERRHHSRLHAPALTGVAVAMLTMTAAQAQAPAPAPGSPSAPTAAPAPAQTVVEALSAPPDQTPAKAGAFTVEELEQIAAPIALYPDPLLAQVMMASTYPLEIVEAARWQKANPTVTGDAVAGAMESQDWDASVKSLVAFPEVLTMLDEKLDWTQKLGDAVLAQQAALMAAVQRLRAKAQASGNLKSSKEQNVVVEAAPATAANQATAPAATPAAAAAPGAAPAPAAATDATTVVVPPAETTTIIKIEPADPEVVYVPTYNPTVVYGPWPYPAYPPYYYYPPYYGGAFFSFSVGVIVGGALWGNCNWGGNDININVNRYNNFNRTEINNGRWNHDASHRKGVQYRDAATQERFGKGQSANTVQSREQFRGHADRSRQQLGNVGTQDLAGNRLGGQGGAGAGTRDVASNRQAGSAATRPTQSPGASNRASPTSSGSRGSEAFRGTSSGSYTRSASQRGYSSRSAGGFSRGGGGGGRRR